MARDDGGAAATIITAFVLGALTGAAVALLMAPTTGEDMRRRLGDTAREGKDAAAEAARQGREFVDRHRGTVVSAIERGRQAYEQARGAGSMPQAPGQAHSTGSGQAPSTGSGQAPSTGSGPGDAL